MKKKSKGKGSSTTALNPAPDPRVRTIGPPSARGAQLQKGYIITSPGGSGIDGRINFMFNPQSIGVTHAANANSAAAPTVAQPQGMPAEIYQTWANPVGTLTVSLLFDRTYEVWDGTKGQTSKLGCYQDILAFYALFGVIGSSKSDLIVTRTKSGLSFENYDMLAGIFPSQPIAFPTVYMYLGRVMRYHGFITGMTATITHWSEKMIPMRCSVDFSMNLAPDPADTKTKVPGSRKNAKIPDDPFAQNYTQNSTGEKAYPDGLLGSR